MHINKMKIKIQNKYFEFLKIYKKKRKKKIKVVKKVSCNIEEET